MFRQAFLASLINLKSLLSFTVVLTLFLLLAAPVFSHNHSFALSEDIKAETFLLMDAHTGRILYQNNADITMAPASLTKIMTLLIAVEALDQGEVEWDEMVTVSQRANETGGSQMFLSYNIEVPFKELIKGIAIISANDACVAVAEHLYGSKEAFVHRMNQKAEELGLENTSFSNASGLHSDSHYMSAKDVAKLSQYLIQNHPEITSLQSEPSYATSPKYTHEDEEIVEYNRNPLLGNYEGADGIKTGWTSQAGYSLAATAERDKLRFISVVMKTDSNNQRRRDTETLLNYGFNYYRNYHLATPGETVESIPVERGTEDEIPLVATETLKMAVPKNEEHKLALEVTPKNEIQTPIEKGETLAEVKVLFEEEIILDSTLEAGQDIARLGFFAHLWDQTKSFFSGLWQQIWGNVTEFFVTP